MSVIVIDPGHGGTKSIPNDSSWNNATSFSGVREKDLTLDLAKRIRWSLQAGSGKQRATASGKKVTVVLTRESDVNLSFKARGGFVVQHRAAIFLSLHFNASNAHTARGTEAWIDRKYAQYAKSVEGPGIPSSGLRNVNVAADAMLASAVADATYEALRDMDPKAVLRSDSYNAATNGEAYTPPAGVKMKGLGVLRDATLGTAANRCRAALLEVDFIDTKAVDTLLCGAKSEANRNALASAIAIALAEAV
jgi:N-acetylmuramoyl-L-alanine amidase